MFGDFSGRLLRLIYMLSLFLTLLITHSLLSPLWVSSVLNAMIIFIILGCSRVLALPYTKSGYLLISMFHHHFTFTFTFTFTFPYSWFLFLCPVFLPTLLPLPSTLIMVIMSTHTKVPLALVLPNLHFHVLWV